MSKRKESLSLSDGYFGDDDTESRSIDDCSHDRDFVVDNGPPSPFFTVRCRKRNRKKEQSRKRKLKCVQSNRFAIENPRHPDIDVSLTRHVPSHQYKTHIVPANESTNSLSFLESQPVYRALVDRALERLCDSKSRHQHQAIKEAATKEERQISTVEGLGSLAVISCQNMQLEDALSFTNCPRILIQAEYPYNTIYTNAAYAKLKSKANEDNKNLPLFHEIDSTMASITSLFGPSNKVTVFPVWRGEISHCKGCSPSLTHFLFEVKSQGKQTHLVRERAVEDCQTQEKLEGSTFNMSSKTDYEELHGIFYEN